MKKGVNELSARMKKEAVELGLCEQWAAEWADATDKDELVRKFVRGIDFCIEHDWPSPEVMKRDFWEVIHRHGVYVDENVEAMNAPVVVLNGECVGSLEYSGTAVGEVYVRHLSEACVRVTGAARVFINLYDKGEVTVECDADSRCFVYAYGDNIIKRGKSGFDGEIVVRDKRGGERNEKE